MLDQDGFLILAYFHTPNPSAAAGKKRKTEGGAHKAGGWTLKEEEAVRLACEAAKGHGYEVAYEIYKGAMAGGQKAKQLGYTWPRGM
jgi:hypothetical protein